MLTYLPLALINYPIYGCDQKYTENLFLQYVLEDGNLVLGNTPCNINYNTKYNIDNSELHKNLVKRHL